MAELVDAERYGINPATAVCQLHRRHEPLPLELQVHHVWPLGVGGPDIASNRAVVCPTGHRNLHKRMRDLVAGLPAPRTGNLKERRYAMQGYQAWVNAGKPPGKWE